MNLLADSPREVEKEKYIASETTSQGSGIEPNGPTWVLKAYGSGILAWVCRVVSISPWSNNGSNGHDIC